ncbi:MAG: hypothetical protein HPY79_12380 [Bacteroidales bacterium]|nr:hypothetical protein [Bacteroidales bacterium]
MKKNFTFTLTNPSMLHQQKNITLTYNEVVDYNCNSTAIYPFFQQTAIKELNYCSNFSLYNPQAYNRYSYCLNNPLKYVDSEGNHPLLIAALIGASFSTYTGWKVGKAHGAKGEEMFGYILGGAIVGGVSGFGGAGLGTLASEIGVTGVLGGVAWGATSGAIMGGISGGITSALVNGDFISGAKIVAITGGILGGIMGGIKGYSDALAQGRNPWTGSKQPVRNKYFFDAYLTDEIKQNNLKYLRVDDKHIKYGVKRMNNDIIALTEPDKKIGTISINGLKYNRYSAKIYFSKKIVNDLYYNQSLISEKDIIGTFYHENKHASDMIFGRYDYYNLNFGEDLGDFIQEYNAYKYEFIMNGTGFYSQYNTLLNKHIFLIKLAFPYY